MALPLDDGIEELQILSRNKKTKPILSVASPDTLVNDHVVESEQSKQDDVVDRGDTDIFYPVCYPNQNIFSCLGDSISTYLHHNHFDPVH